MQNEDSLRRHGFKRTIWLDDNGNEFFLWSKDQTYKSPVFGMWPGYGDTFPYLLSLPSDFPLGYKCIENEFD